MRSAKPHLTPVFASVRRQQLLAHLGPARPPALKPSELSVATEDYPCPPPACTCIPPGTTGNPLAQELYQLRPEPGRQN